MSDEFADTADFLDYCVQDECENCNDRKCMACVLRQVHDRCVDDCPSCVSYTPIGQELRDLLTAAERHWENYQHETPEDKLRALIQAANYWQLVAETSTTERNAWIKSWNRLEAAVSHHKKDKSAMFVDEIDEALYAARARIVRARTLGDTDV
jgi:hypothetical protein